MYICSQDQDMSVLKNVDQKSKRRLQCKKSVYFLLFDQENY